MVNEQPGKYNKDRFKPKPWFETPLVGSEAEAAWKRFQASFGHRQWQFDSLAYLKWSHVLVFYDYVNVFDFDEVAREPWFWAFASSRKGVYKVTLGDAKISASTRSLEGWYVVPESFEWCLCGTHDWQLWFCDPMERLRNLWSIGPEGSGERHWMLWPIDIIESQSALQRFDETFHHSKKPQISSHETWKHAIKFNANHRVLELDLVTRDKWVWSMSEGCRQPQRAPVDELLRDLRNRERYFACRYFFPASMDWCIWFETDGHGFVCDPGNLFREFLR